MIELYYWPTPNGHKVTIFLEEAGLDYPSAEYTVADMAAYPRIVPWKRQQQDLDSFKHVRRWYDAVGVRPAAVRAYAKVEAFTQPAVTEEGKKLLFDQTAANTADATTAGSAPV